MISTTIFPGRYIQGYDAIMELGREISRFGKKGFLICDPFVLENILPHIMERIQKESSIIVEKFNGECSDEEISRLLKLGINANAEAVIGIGGGKTQDTAKTVAYELKVPVIIVPTIASTDAPCSALSVIYTPKGNFKRYLILPRNPDVVLVDTKIISQAPIRFLISGMGDALATWFEADSCQKSNAPNMTGKIGSMTAHALARLCYETLIEYGLMAKLSCEVNAVTPALEHIVEANTLLSGLGFESGGLASAHSIHNGLTVLEKTHKYYHGEKVAFGVLTSLFLTDKPASLIDEVYDFCESVGLPTTLAEIGLSNITEEELKKVAESTCAKGETIHNEPFPVNPSMVISAIKAADATGHARKIA